MTARGVRPGVVGSSPTRSDRGPFVGIQIGPESFLDEGADEVLGSVTERAACNAVLINTHSFAYGTMGRPPKDLYPGHGQVAGEERWLGGAFVPTDPQYYRFTRLTWKRAAETGLVDVLADALEVAPRFGLRVYARIAENAIGLPLAKVIPGYVNVLARDHNGCRVDAPCLNHPDYRGWYRATAEELLKTYPGIQGLCIGMEGRGPLYYTAAKAQPGRCFCTYCVDLGRDRGVSAQRVKEGFSALQTFARKAQAGRPRDGYFVEFFKVLLRYPEVLAWEQLFNDSKTDFRRDLYGVVKALDAAKEVGWHRWKVNSYDPFLRAGVDYERASEYADWLKPAVYHNNGGSHLKRQLRAVGKTIFGDLSARGLVEFHERTMGYAGLPELERLGEGLPTSYVEAETRRVVEAVGGEVAVYPGIDVDIPVDADAHRTEPGDVAAAVRAAFAGGARGIVVSRKYSEQRPENLAAVGGAVRALRTENVSAR